MSTDNRAALKNCPFCGGDASAEPHLQHKSGCYFDVLAQFKAAPIGDLSMADEVLAAWNRRAQPAEDMQPATEGYVLMPCRLTAANGAKAALSDEFAEKVTYHCSQCDHDEPDDGCEECNGEGSYLVDIPVEWDTIKRIYDKAVESLAGSVTMAATAVAFREVAKDGTPITDWIDGSLPPNTPPLHPGATIQFAYGHPLSVVAQPVADERARFEVWASEPFRAEKMPLEMHPNGAYKDTRSYLIWYGWKARAALCQPAEEGGV